MYCWYLHKYKVLSNHYFVIYVLKYAMVRIYRPRCSTINGLVQKRGNQKMLRKSNDLAEGQNARSFLQTNWSFLTVGEYHLSFNNFSSLYVNEKCEIRFFFSLWKILETFLMMMITVKPSNLNWQTTSIYSLTSLEKNSFNYQNPIGLFEQWKWRKYGSRLIQWSRD